MSAKMKTVRVPIVDDATSLGDRIQSIKNDIALILCGSERISDQNTIHLDYQDVADGILEAARRAFDHAFWLQQLPEDVLAIAAPTTDEAEEAARGDAQ
jgi:hypothetical protein